MGTYLIFMGAQGAGKGSQAVVFSKELDIPHISTGDLFRALRSRQDDFALKIQDTMKRGEMVSDEDTNAILLERLSQPDAARGAILDGYPRNPAQAQWLADYLASKGEKLTAAVLLEIDLYTAFKRAFGRVSAADGSSYNIYFNVDGVDWQFEEHETKAYPPRLVAKHTATGEMLQRRADDASAHAILKRIDTYMEQTAPLINFYEKHGLLVRVNADQPLDQVGDDIRKAIMRHSESR